MDDSWVYQYDSETKTTSMSIPLLQKNGKSAKANREGHTLFFWDYQGVILTGYLPSLAHAGLIASCSEK